MKGNENGVKRFFEDYLNQLVENEYLVITQKQAYSLVGDYCLVKEINYEDFTSWLKLSLPQWLNENLDGKNWKYPSVSDLLKFLDEQSTEMKEIDQLIEEIG